MKIRRLAIHCLGLVWGLMMFHLAGAQVVELTGVNKGEDLYVKNPYLISQAGFCVQEVYVNGQKNNMNLNLMALRIKLDDVAMYSPVHVKIIHADSCQPRIVNPDAILYYSAFKFDSLVMKDSVLHWYTKGDSRSAKFVVERLKADFWDEVTEVRPKGRFNGAEYVFVPELKDGGNKFRVRYELPNGRYLYSQEIEYFHYPSGVTFSPRVVTNMMYFSREARYEIMNSEGEIILQGTAKEIPLRRLQPGDYSILLEGELDSFIKK